MSGVKGLIMTLFYRNVKDWQLRKCLCRSCNVNSALKRSMSIWELYAGGLPSAYISCVCVVEVEPVIPHT